MNLAIHDRLKPQCDEGGNRTDCDLTLTSLCTLHPSMRLWTKAETRALTQVAVGFSAVTVLAQISLPADWASSVSIVLATVLLTGIALSVRRQLVAWLEFERGQQQAMHGIHRVLPLRAPLPALTGWAATPGLVSEALQCVSRAHASVPDGRTVRVLECGSGVSTLAIGYALQQNGGHILSLDHDASYGAQTTELARLHGLTNEVQVVHAPLVQHTIDGESYPWYDLSGVGDAPIDVLIVDGPPESTRRQARYPAFPLLESRLADDAWILLDDAARTDEHRAIERWQLAAKGKLSVRFFEDGRGYAVAHYRRE